MRRVLYLATLTALRRKDNARSRFYYRLRERGKPGKVVMGCGHAEVAVAPARHRPPGDAAGHPELGRQFPENPLTANTDTPA